MTSVDWKDDCGIDWPGLRNRPMSREERRAVREFYSSNYHDRSHYTIEDPYHELVHRRRAELLLAVFPNPGKTLDAGCSAGGTVQALRRLEVDAWGFDACPDLPDMAYEDVRDVLRVGEFDSVPFSRLDGFKTLVSYDVFEHVAIDIIECFPQKARELGIENICCIIANDTLTKEHVTIQETAWYRERFLAAGYRLMDEITEDLRSILWPTPSAKVGSQYLQYPYEWAGEPKNGWNEVPGMLFFTRV